MPISPWYVGQTLPLWSGTMMTDNGSTADLTGATLSLAIHNAQTGLDVAGAGTFQLTDAPNGAFTYAWAAADVTTPGTYDLIVTATYPNSGGVLVGDPIPWDVLPR